MPAPPENHMVLPSAAPEAVELPDLLAGCRQARCVTCGVEAVLYEGDWIADAEVERDTFGDTVVDGNTLCKGEETPLGFCCSKRCRSQAMFSHADASEQEALRRVSDACRVIAEYGRIAVRVLESGMEDSPRELIAQAEDFLEITASSEDDTPEWCNRPTREESLENAASRCAAHLKWLADRMSLTAQSAMRTNHPGAWSESETYNSGRDAASCAAEALELKEAL